MNSRPSPRGGNRAHLHSQLATLVPPLFSKTDGGCRECVIFLYFFLFLKLDLSPFEILFYAFEPFENHLFAIPKKYLLKNHTFSFRNL